jgi:RNA polymerase sigma-70 factor, ECF subfamily
MPRSREYSTEEFERAALPFVSDLYRTAARIVGRRAEAEDLVQEAYLQAWKSFHRFQPGTNCRAWLFKILFHVIQHYRRKAFALNYVVDAEVLLAEVPASTPAADAVTDEDILAALDTVPEPYRAVLLLVDVQEFSYREVSEILQIPVGTVMSRLNRGRSQLRKALANWHPAGAVAHGADQTWHPTACVGVL